MLRLFAQALPDPNSYTAIGWVLVVLFVIGGGVLIIQQIFRKDPPLHKEYVTRQEHSELKQRVEQMADKIDDNFRALDQKRSVSIAGLHHDLANRTDAVRKEIKTDVGGLHDRLNMVLTAVAHLEGKVGK